MIKAIFFDAFGTLFSLTKTVGEHYALIGRQIGLNLQSGELEHAFHGAWRSMPQRAPIDGPRENDDKDWWRELVERVLANVVPGLNELDRDNFFELAYEHFAEPNVWELYPEVVSVLQQLQPQFSLGVLSNFDGRLRFILHHLGIAPYFAHVFISSELGADKPDPEIFRRALEVSGFAAREVLHVGDDPERDWEAAEAAGLQVFPLERPRQSLHDLICVV